jgi:hypothetical protein
VLPYEALRALRSNIGQQIDWNPFSSAGPTNGLYKAIYGAMGRDLDEGASAFGEDVAQQIRDNSSAYRSAASVRDSLAGIVNRAGGPEKVYSALFNSAKGGSTPLSAVLSNVDFQTRQLLAASALERMGRALPGAQNAAGDVFSADRFLTNWNNLAPQARTALFSSLPGDYAASIDQLVANAGKLKAYGKVLAARGNPSLGAFTLGALAESAMHFLPGFHSLVRLSARIGP